MPYVATLAVVGLGLALTSGASAGPAGAGPGGSIYSVRDNGTDRRLVVQPQIPARSFIRSPGGRSIVYLYEVDGVLAYFAADVSGANPIRLTTARVVPNPPNGVAFSPDGRTIAFSAFEACGNVCQRFGLYLVDRDGSNLRFAADRAFDPSWAPDGRRIAYSGPAGIEVADIRTGDKKVISKPYSYSPLWSPRGDRIAYETSAGYATACTVAPDGSRKRCTHGRSFVSLVWSHDGRELAFKQISPSRLGTMDEYARHLRRFKPIDRRARPVAWSPDDTRLAYSFGADGEFDDVVNVMRIGTPRRAVLRVVYEPRTTLTDIRWRGHRITYIAG
jgi:Tol biopolymer transport system component